MTSAEISRKEKWELANEQLNLVFESEIHLMREILTTLHQEEFSLLENNRASLRKVLAQRSDLVCDLAKKRLERMEATVELTKSAVLHRQKEIASFEIHSKLDQITALIEKSNLQNCRNDALFEERKESEKNPLACPFPHPLHRARRRSRVATFTKKG